MTVKIPQEKLISLRSQLQNIAIQTKVTLKQLQELTGLLNFCVRAIPAGRAFIRRLYDASCGLKKPHHRRRVNNEMKEDIYTWLFFLNRFNGITSYRQVDWANGCDLELFTDSAGNPDLGCGAVFGSHWVYLLWPQNWKSLNVFSLITFLELVPIAMAFAVWGRELLGKKVILHTDNQALVIILNTKTSKSKLVMILLRPLILQSLIYNIQFKGVHIPGVHNVKADSLSRQQWRRFHSSFPDADPSASHIPQSFLQVIYNIDPGSF